MFFISDLQWDAIIKEIARIVANRLVSMETRQILLSKYFFQALDSHFLFSDSKGIVFWIDETTKLNYMWLWCKHVILTKSFSL